MAKIILREPNSPYRCETNTDIMEVEIREAFLGIGFDTEDGEKLSVSMRDSGFELLYKIDEETYMFIELKNGSLTQKEINNRI